MKQLKTPFKFAVAVAVIFSVSACSGRSVKPANDLRFFQNPAAAEAEKPVAEWKQRGADEIAPGFDLTLQCSADPAVSGKYRVEPDGKLKLPYDVELDAAGKTLSQLTT